MTEADPAPESEPAGLLERHFELSARGTSLRTEVLAGFTTFLTMAYIVLVVSRLFSCSRLGGL